MPTRAEELQSTLAELDQGRLQVELHATLRDAVRAARDTGKPAKVTLALIISPKGDRRVQIHGEVKGTLPKPDTLRTLFFCDDDGALTRHDPEQPALPLGSARQAV